jgi:hypothetical protein
MRFFIGNANWQGAVDWNGKLPAGYYDEWV